MFPDSAMRFFQIVVGLQSEPESFAGAQRGGEANGGVGGHAAFAEDDLIDAAWRNVGGAGEGVLADAKWDQEFFEQNFAGMNVGQGLHGCLIIQW